MKKSFILLLAVLFTGILAVAAVNLTGNWEFSMTTQRGEMKADLKFVQTGDKLEVTMTRTNPQGQATETKGTGTVKDKDVEFSITRTTQRGEMTTVYKGTIVDDNTITGKVEMGQNSVDWKATKKK
ncbi:MAG: hypothetical protein ABSF88_06780 [Candidatus Aminicenantales bacterium]|jgi:hypothetical protein